MELVLTRTKLDSNSTEGELCLHGDGHQLCYTLELPVKDGLPGSAIPPGKYQILLQPSPKFMASADPWVLKYASAMPHVICPPRTLIMIHFGNDAADTEGCILVGQTQGVDFIGGSREAFAALYPFLLAAQQAGEAITLQVNGGIPLQNG